MSQALPPARLVTEPRPASRALRATILHAETSALSLSNRWQDASGFTVPASFSDPVAELSAVEAGVGLGDASAITALQIGGADARDFLVTVLLGPVEELKPGQRARVAWAGDEGCLRGTGEVHALGYDQFRLISEVGDFGWFADAAAGFTVKLDSLTGQLGAIEIAGPAASAFLDGAGLPVSGLGAGDLRFLDWLGAQARIGVDGAGQRYRLWAGAADAPVLWRNLMRLGQDFGLVPIGALAQEALRIHLAEPRAGIDWMPVQWALSSDLVRKAAALGFDIGGDPGGKLFAALLIGPNQNGTNGKIPAGAIPSSFVTSLAPSLPGGPIRAMGWIGEADAKPGQRVALASGQQATVTRRIFAAPTH